jgi:hypothetical protein
MYIFTETICLFVCVLASYLEFLYSFLSIGGPKVSGKHVLEISEQSYLIILLPQNRLQLMLKLHSTQGRPGKFGGLGTLDRDSTSNSMIRESEAFFPGTF